MSYCPEIDQPFSATINNLDTTAMEYLPDCTPNLTDMELRVTGIGGEPYFVIRPDGELAGYDLDTIRIIVDKVNAKLKVEMAVDWIAIKKDENGTELFNEDGTPILVGCIPEVMYRRATFAVAEILYIPDTFPMVDYMIHSHQYLHFRSARPGVLAPTWNLVKPFSLTVWIWVSCVFVVLAAFYATFVHYSEIVHNEDITGSWFNSALSIYMHQLSQGMTMLDKNQRLSMRIFVFHFSMYAFLIHAFYDCNLRAYLMVADLEPVVESAKDIYDQVKSIHTSITFKKGPNAQRTSQGPLNSSLSLVGSSQCHVGSSQGHVGSSSDPVGSSQDPEGSSQGPISSSLGPEGSPQGPVSKSSGPVSSSLSPIGSSQGQVGSSQGPVSSSSGLVGSS